MQRWRNGEGEFSDPKYDKYSTAALAARNTLLKDVHARHWKKAEALNEKIAKEVGFESYDDVLGYWDGSTDDESEEEESE